MDSFCWNYTQDILSAYECVEVLYANVLSPNIIELIKKDEHYFVVKRIKKDCLLSKHLIQQTENELNFCKAFVNGHTNIVNYYDCLETEHDFRILIEYIKDARYLSDKIDQVSL